LGYIFLSKNLSKKNTLKFDDNNTLQIMCGVYHSNLDVIEKKLNVSLSSRGNLISILGNPKNIIITKNTLSKLYERAKLVNIIEEQDVEAIIKFMNDHDKNGKKQSNNYKNYFIKTPKGTIFPRSKGQENLIKQISEKQLVFAIGPAGTGKTFLAVSHAVSFLVSGMVDRIIISRPAVEAGEKLGFLPGDFKQKVDPYLKPIYDSLHENLPNEKVLKLVNNEKIEIAPIAFMRGRTLNNAYVILDEAQNTSAVQMKMFLTRLGNNSKMVVTGDLTQIDLPSEQKSGLIDAERNLKNINNISFVYLSEQDVVRHALVSEIIKAYKK
tara:strand:- start:232 stop:1206 length:975 start_codon:yes stop_codon:yes gene_type:complete